jgi:hypothetical protein
MILPAELAFDDEQRIIPQRALTGVITRSIIRYSED